MGHAIQAWARSASESGHDYDEPKYAATEYRDNHFDDPGGHGWQGGCRQPGRRALCGQTRLGYCARVPVLFLIVHYLAGIVDCFCLLFFPANLNSLIKFKFVYYFYSKK